MPIGYAELQRFYEALVLRAREAGVTCAITSGMACVAHGVAQTTKDCDLLCAPDAAERFLKLLTNTRFGNVLPQYRGHITPPLDARWLVGGWTSHFVWKSADRDAYLDVFGVPPRATSDWTEEIEGFYSSPHVVAEMKRTNRKKDWPFATALGVKMLKAGDERGWLHIFDDEALLSIKRRLDCPEEMAAHRPVLRLLSTTDSRLEAALLGERIFWEQLDRGRIKVYERAVRAYMLAVKKDSRSHDADLMVQHRARVEFAERLLATDPLKQYGVERLVSEARKQAEQLVAPGALQWLPDARKYFRM